MDVKELTDALVEHNAKYLRTKFDSLFSELKALSPEAIEIFEATDVFNDFSENADYVDVLSERASEIAREKVEGGLDLVESDFDRVKSVVELDDLYLGDWSDFESLKHHMNLIAVRKIYQNELTRYADKIGLMLKILAMDLEVTRITSIISDDNIESFEFSS